MNELTAISDLSISSREYELISKLVYDRFGINLGSKKQSLVSNRLRKVLIENKFSSFKAYYEHILNDKSGASLDILINKISTNLTYFAREQEHFNYLKDTVLPELFYRPEIARNNSLRIWCAGCSTGEEAYTLSMIMHEAAGGSRSKWKLDVLATDISARALKIAESGIYKDENVEKMQTNIKHKYFQKTDMGDWIVTNEIRNKVLFRRLNLMRSQFPFKKKFHSIFCRNVMIYFDTPTREELVKKFSANLIDEGYLFIGHSESLGRANPYFDYIRPAVYRKKA
jgi:chemotaxis protein methyltransferase CheR